MKKETSKRLSAGLLASAIVLNTVLSISADDGINYVSVSDRAVVGTFTSAPDITLDTTIGASEAAILEGSFDNWIGQLDLSGKSYAKTMYDKISDPDFWTTSENFAQANYADADAVYIKANYDEDKSDEFNALCVYTEGPRDENFTAEEKKEVLVYCRAAYDAFDRDCPEVFWLTGQTDFRNIVTMDDDGKYTLNTYLVLKDYKNSWDMRYSDYQNTASLKAKISDMNDEADDIVAAAGDTDYEKVKYFNKYLIAGNDYDKNAATEGSDGAAEALNAILCTGDGLTCEGYARAFKVLCDEAGISCMLVDGQVNGASYMWNYAKIDGAWYLVDVTANELATEGSDICEDYLLIGSDAAGDDYPVSNTASLYGTSFTSIPALSAASYEAPVEEITARAVLEGEEGENGWTIKNALLKAPDGYLISTDGITYGASVSFDEFTNEEIYYYLAKEDSDNGTLIPEPILVKFDNTAPKFAKDEGGNSASYSATTDQISVTVKAAEDDSGLKLTYSGVLNGVTASDETDGDGILEFDNLTPGTEYSIRITVKDQAGNKTEGTITAATKQGTATRVQLPTITGVYGTAVENMAISGGTVKYNSTIIEGTWEVTDEESYEIPDVGTTKAYKVTFTPSSSAYEAFDRDVVPVVTALSIDGAFVTGAADSYTYTGAAIQPAVKVTLNGQLLTENTDYQVVYGSNKNCGYDAGTITVKGTGNYTGEVYASFDILQADAKITYSVFNVERDFGDNSFDLVKVAGISSTNKEDAFAFDMKKNSVVEVSDDGWVTIKGAGTVAVYVSQPESLNYKASNTITVWVTIYQAEEADAGKAELKFIYSAEHNGEFDAAEFISANTDCGTLSEFSAAEKKDSASIISKVSIDADGILTFDVAKGSKGDEATISIEATSQNYETVTMTVVVILDDKISTKAKKTIAAGNKITYGQTLSDIAFSSDVFVDSSGTEIKGALEWVNPDHVPSVTETTAKWIFTPEDSDHYAVCEGEAKITVSKATPTVVTPTVTGMTYDADRKLADVAINGENGKATVGGEETEVKGAWSWKNPATVPNCKTVEYPAVFTPDDLVNYSSVEVKVLISVSKAEAEITKVPTATAITYGQKVSDSTLKNGTANAAGKFAWADGDEVYSVGKYDLEVLFTPTDTTNYTGTSTTVTLTVNKAKNAPNMPSSKISASYDITTVGGVELPEYWNWDSADSYKGLAVGSSATATAVYNGLDKGNYENESIVITVTRSKCSHKNTAVINVKEATCTEKGYTGDTYCYDCSTVTVSGSETAIADHKGGKATCSTLAYCTVCKKTYGELDSDNHSGTKVIKNAIAATATSAGYTGDVCCSDCGSVIEKGSIIPISSAVVTTSSNSWNDVTTTTAKDSTTIVTTTAKTTTTTTKTTTAADDDDDDSKYDEDAPFIYDDDEKYGWDDIVKEITSAKSGNKVEVDMNYTTQLSSKALSALKGKNVELVLHMDDYFCWVINGMNVTSSKNINMEVLEGEDDISVDIIDQVTGDAYSTTLTLTHSGEFGFTAILRYEAGDPGYYANLYYYNPTKEVATFVTSDKIDSDGYAELAFDHASDYIVVIDEYDHSSRAGIEYDGNDDDTSDDDDADYEEDDGDYDVVLDEDLFADNDYYTGGEKNPSTGFSFGHVLVGILGVSAFAVRPKNEKRKRKVL